MFAHKIFLRIHVTLTTLYRTLWILKSQLLCMNKRGQQLWTLLFGCLHVAHTAPLLDYVVLSRPLLSVWSPRKKKVGMAPTLPYT